MEIQVHVSVPESYSDSFEEMMLQRFGMHAADAEIGSPINLTNALELEEQAEKIFWYVVATKRMTAIQIQARVADLQSFLREQQIGGHVIEVEFEADGDGGPAFAVWWPCMGTYISR